LCKGDSGGPLVYIPNTSSPIPMLAGVLSNSEIMYSDQVCTNNSWGHDDAKYSRANWGKISRLFSKANITCSKESSSGISYRKCFSGNVSEPTKLTFDCRIQGSNKGCKKIISCPAGTKIVSAKATCNLEHGSVKDSDLNNTKYGRIKVIRESDNMKAGLCRIGKTKKRKKGSKVFNTKGIIGQSSTQIFCKEHDKNGGDCHIKASLACF